jgi:hypothetical protein
LNPRLRPWQGRTLPLSYSRSAKLIINEGWGWGNGWGVGRHSQGDGLSKKVELRWTEQPGGGCPHMQFSLAMITPAITATGRRYRDCRLSRSCFRRIRFHSPRWGLRILYPFPECLASSSAGCCTTRAKRWRPGRREARQSSPSWKGRQ